MKNFLMITILLFIIIPVTQIIAQPEGDYIYYSVAESGTLTVAIDLRGVRLLSITPEASTSGTVLTFWHSNYSDSTFHKVQYAGSDVSVTFVPGKTSIMKREETLFFRYIKK